MLIPDTARPWLSPDSRRRRWSNHGAMMIRRGEALDALGAAYGSWLRFGLGALAWALAVGGAVLVGQGIADDGEGFAGGVGTGLLLIATALAGLLVATGASLTRAIAEWWTLATQVGADGGPVDAAAGHETRRAHEAAVAADRKAGPGALWRLPLLPRTLAVVVLTVLAVVLLVQAGLGAAEATTPYAGGDVRGPWLTRLLVAGVSLLTAWLVLRGLRRVHRARMHRGTPTARATSAPPAVHTPAVGTGSIVIGGRAPVAGPPPAWASPVSAPSSDGAPPADVTAPAPLASAPPPAPLASTPPPAPAMPAPSGAPATAGPTVRLGDGRQLDAGVTLVGRAPAPRPGEHADATLAVADEQVSKTHLTVTVDASRAVVVDRGSTNGTVVHHPDGTELALRPGEALELAEGDVVVLGTTTLTVGEPDVEHTVLRR